jgi:single-strand DNA-binding protein
MSLQLNQLTLAGNLTADPLFRVLANDRSVVNFTVGTNRGWKDANGDRHSEATFVACQAWGKLADLVAGHFAKGDPIYVQGRLQLESWDGRDGGKNTRPVCIIDTVSFVASKERPPGAPATAPVAAAPLHLKGSTENKATPAAAVDEPTF